MPKTNSSFQINDRLKILESEIEEKNTRTSISPKKKSEDKEDKDRKMTVMDKIRMIGGFKDIQPLNLKDRSSIKPSLSSMYSHSVQVIRSAGNWSLGLKSNKIENSIHLAYLELIKRAEHFIYIENQFFISATAGDPIRN